MTDIGNINIADYDYNLPDGRIAKHPLSQRDSSKLLVYKDGGISQSEFSAIDALIPEDSFLILNNTKVVRARLRFRKTSGATIEIFLLEPIMPADYAQSFACNQQVTWKCLVGNLKRWKEGSLELTIPNTEDVLTASKLNILSEGLEIRFSWENSDLSFAQIIERCGEVPIPPYLNRKTEDEDNTRYQTVYASPEGSVAAPTAGLHFTSGVFEKLAKKNVFPHYLTLHVGAGTFKPMKAEHIGDHEMHTEHFFVERELIQGYLNSKGIKIVVGTTTLRTLESLYWLGVKLAADNNLNQFFVSQWEPYELRPIGVLRAFEAILRYMDEHRIDTFSASTQIMIAPSYPIRTADALITNFHQPKSTLLLLVSALVGNDWHRIYRYAMEHDFRFLSYGDSSILFDPKRGKTE